MNKISANKLTRMSAVQLYNMLNNPSTERKKTAFQPEVLAEPKDTPKNLAMSASTLVGDVRVYFSFDEIIDNNTYAVLVDKRQYRENSPESHFYKCVSHLAGLAALVETSGKILTTVKCLTSRGYDYKRVDLRDKRLEFVLQLGDDKLYGLQVTDKEAILEWMLIKMEAIQTPETAILFDESTLSLSPFYKVWPI